MRDALNDGLTVGGGISCWTHKIPLNRINQRSIRIEMGNCCWSVTFYNSITRHELLWRALAEDIDDRRRQERHSNPTSHHHPTLTYPPPPPRCLLQVKAAGISWTKWRCLNCQIRRTRRIRRQLIPVCLSATWTHSNALRQTSSACFSDTADLPVRMWQNNCFIFSDNILNGKRPKLNILRRHFNA